MDVYFCDLCGARLTDTDLSAGQGQRKGFDVICAGCIHQGQGQSWSKARDERRSAASQRIDAARDRAATIDEEDGPARPPTSIVVADPEPEVVTTRVEPSQGLSDMAGGMAAMAMAPAPSSASALERDDGLVEVDDLDDGDDRDQQVRATAATAAVVNPSPAKTTDRRKTTNHSPHKTPTPQPKSGRVAKPGKASTTTRATAKGTGSKRRAQVGTGQWVLFGVAIAVILVLGGLTVVQLGKSTKPVEEVVVKDSALKGQEALAAAIREANAAADEALQPPAKDRAKLEHARSLVTTAYQSALAFEKAAEESWMSQGLSEEDAGQRVGQVLNKMGFYDVRINMKTINEKLARIQ
jgi:hypothetical protein